jgi:CubicO group peptidase (beta-lactamase class C family)
MMRARRAGALLVAAACLLAGPTVASQLSDGEIIGILRARIDTFQQSVGIVVGIVDSSGTRIVGYGPSHAGGTDVVNGSTIFEIGSISKVFTSILLAHMVRQGEVSLRDPVSSYLPPEVHLPTRSGREISLLDLATHRSGLPRMPDEMVLTEEGGAIPFRLDQMYEFLSTTTLAYDIGERYYYSNLAFGLLGHVLASHAGTDFESLLLERVCRPLGLSDTRVTLNAEQQQRLAGTHNWNHGKTPPLEWETMMSAGGVRSTATDLLRFLASNMDLSTDLWFPLQMSHLDRRDTSSSSMQIGLGWHLAQRHGRELIWHSGATFGNMAFLAFDKEARRGVVVLSNARGIIDDIGMHLLDSQTKLADFKELEPLPPAVEVSFEKLERYAGEYELGPNSILNIRAEDGKLYASLNEGLRFELLAASETELFSTMSPSIFEFDVDRKDEVDGLTVRVFGYEQEATKLEHYRRPPKRTGVVSKGNLQRFVGRYRLPNDSVATVSLVDGLLSVGVEGQLRMPLVPTSDGFFAQAADAELVFVEDEDGLVTELVLHQEGEHRAVRVEE